MVKGLQSLIDTQLRCNHTSYAHAPLMIIASAPPLPGPTSVVAGATSESKASVVAAGPDGGDSGNGSTDTIRGPRSEVWAGAQSGRAATSRLDTQVKTQLK